MTDGQRDNEASIWAGWLIYLGLLSLFAIFIRSIAWAFGFPQGGHAVLIVLLAGLPIALLMWAVRQSSGHFLGVSYWNGSSGWTRLQSIVYWLVSGLIFGSFLRISSRLLEPSLNLSVNKVDIIIILVSGLFWGGCMILGQIASSKPYN